MGSAVLLEAVRATAPRPRRVVLAGSMTVYGEGRYECPGCGEAKGATRDPELLANGSWEPRCSFCRSPLTPRPTSESFPFAVSNLYAHSKAGQEEILRLLAAPAGIETVVLRLFNVYGPGQALDTPYPGVVAIFTSCLQLGIPPVVFEDGVQLRDFVFVEDVSAAFFLAWGCSAAAGGIYNIGSGIGRTLPDLLALPGREFPNAPATRILSATESETHGI